MPSFQGYGLVKAALSARGAGLVWISLHAKTLGLIRPGNAVAPENSPGTASTPFGRSTKLTAGVWQVAICGLPSEEKITCPWLDNGESSSNIRPSLMLPCY
jgi:hypothetical protein